MTQKHENEVTTAFDILLEEIENAIEGLNQDGARAFQKADYALARDLMEKGSQMVTFRERLNELQKEWRNIFPAASTRPARRKPSPKAAKRLQRGLRTREDAFRIPILQALIQLDGSAPMTDVLDRVETLMKGQLNEYDHSPLPSYPESSRWRNTAQWARNTMEKVSYAHNTVWLDKAQTCGFRGVPEAVWNFYIGGYQVCEKWLKDRKGRVLSGEDIEHYQRIVVALNETIRLMLEIDEVIEAHGGWPGGVAQKPHNGVRLGR